ncbi:MAG: hypothetical protein QOJ20_6144 [Mycobacterium sp.]|jgi:hypothetical protein|nr:hypothetical protein [Mycobacterium sp.]
MDATRKALLFAFRSAVAVFRSSRTASHRRHAQKLHEPFARCYRHDAVPVCGSILTEVGAVGLSRRQS